MKEISAESFVNDKLLRIYNNTMRSDLVLTTNSVLLRKRYRDMTDDDLLGIFDSFGTWTSINSRNFYPMNIIKPMIATKTAAIVSADIKVTVEPRITKDSKAEMVADVCNAIKELKSEEQWTHQLKEQLATEPQVAPGVFLKTDWNPHAKNNFVSTVDEWQDDEDTVSGKAVCAECGYETQVADEVIPDESGFATVPCEQCGGEAEIVEQPSADTMPVISGTKKFKTGNTKTEVIPAFEICIDERGTQGGNVKAARWLMHRYLAPAEELIAEYPESESKIDGGMNAEWSYPLRWQHALQTGSDMLYRDTTQLVDDLREIKDLYLTPQMYQHIKLRENFFLGDGKRFAVEAGKGFADGYFNGKPFDEAPVLCFRTVGDSIIDVYPCDFREKFIYISFLSNPSAFWALFLTEMLPLQDVVNYMNTVQIAHTRRNARTTKVLDSGQFNPEDLEKDAVLTKEPLNPGDDIRRSFAFIPSAIISDAPQRIMMNQLELAPNIGQVQPAMTGESQPGEPYAAQRQQKEQSLGQLMPFSRSTALGKVAWTLRQLKEVQENEGEEYFLFLLKLHSDWTEEHIEAFLDANLDVDVIVGYEQGSETPRNLLERELALRQFILDLTQLTELSMTGSPLASPELLNEILLRIKQFTQLDVDVQNTEAELRLADARYDKLMHLIEGMNTGEAPPEALQLIAQSLIQLPDLMPSPDENHGAEIEFWHDKSIQEKSKDSPNWMANACFDAMMQAHKMAAVAAGQEKTGMAIAVNAPAIEAEEEMQNKQMESEAQTKEQENAAKQQDVAVQKEEADKGREHELRMKQIEVMNAERDREHTSELAAKTAKAGVKK